MKQRLGREYMYLCGATTNYKIKESGTGASLMNSQQPITPRFIWAEANNSQIEW